MIIYYYPRRSRDTLQGGEYDHVGELDKWDRLDDVKPMPGYLIRLGIEDQVACLPAAYEQHCVTYVDIPLKRWAVIGTRSVVRAIDLSLTRVT